MSGRELAQAEAAEACEGKREDLAYATPHGLEGPTEYREAAQARPGKQGLEGGWITAEGGVYS